MFSFMHLNKLRSIFNQDLQFRLKKLVTYVVPNFAKEIGLTAILVLICPYLEGIISLHNQTMSDYY